MNTEVLYILSVKITFSNVSQTASGFLPQPSAFNYAALLSQSLCDEMHQLDEAGNAAMEAHAAEARKAKRRKTLRVIK